MRSILLATLLVTALHAQEPQKQPPPACPPPNAHISIESGSYGPQPGVTFRVHRFTGTLEPQGHTAPLCYLKQTLLTHADIYATDDSLTEIFSSKLGSSGSKIKNFKIANVPGEVTLSGEIVKIVPIHFAVKGQVTTDGTILQLRARKIDADGIPVKALLGLIGEHLGAVLNLRGVGGITVQDNTITFAPEKIAHIIGHIQSVESTQAGLALHYSAALAHHHHTAATTTPGPPKAATPGPASR